jgi:hypothetical protein
MIANSLYVILAQKMELKITLTRLLVNVNELRVNPYQPVDKSQSSGIRIPPAEKG